MDFKISHARSMMGNNIEVEIDAEKNEKMVHVRIELDGFPLADDDLEPAAEHYQNDFANAGDAAPLTKHKLVVTATTSDIEMHSSTSVWTDAI